MHYWDEMQSKWGFNDGESIPPHIDLYRSVYIQAVNAIAEELGSEYRARAYDRAGLHNWCMVVTVPKDATDPEAPGVPEGWDGALRRAIALADEMQLDDYVHTTAEIQQDELDDFLTNLEIDHDGDAPEWTI